VRCSSAQACDQLDDALELPWKESTSGENCPDSVKIGSLVFGQIDLTCALTSLSERSLRSLALDTNRGRRRCVKERRGGVLGPETRHRNQ
jgi:hypothetical protein